MTAATGREDNPATTPANGPLDRERPTEELPSYLDAKGFRNRLCLSDRAFRRGLSAGRIPPPDLRWGRSLRWRTETVAAFFESLEAKEGPNSPPEKTMRANRKVLDVLSQT